MFDRDRRNARVVCLLSATLAVSAQYTLTVESPRESFALRNNDVVRVRYASLGGPLLDADWIGVYRYVPPPATAAAVVNATLPLLVLPARPTTNSTHGVGSLVLTNYRDPLTLYVLTGAAVVWEPPPGAGPLLRFADPDEPVRPRVLPTRDRDTLLLAWSTANSTSPTVEYGGAHGAYARTAVAATRRLVPADVCGGLAGGRGWADLGAVHYALLTGLAGVRDVPYRFGDAAAGMWSSPQSARVPRAPGAGGGAPVRIAVLGDLGRAPRGDGASWGWASAGAANTSAALAAAAARGDLDLVALIGDQSYAVGALAGWDAFLDQLAPAAAAVPWAALRGNHEQAGVWQAGDDGGECGTVSAALLPAPAPAPTPPPPAAGAPPDPTALAATPGWYSLDVGAAHIACLSSEDDASPGSAQWRWLAGDLAAVNRSSTPWVVLLTHRPLVVDSSDAAPRPGGADQEVAAVLRGALEPLLFAHRVNVVVAGHNHGVQRHAATLGGAVVQRAARTGDGWWEQRDPQAPVHFLWGTGGAAFTFNADGRAPTVEAAFYRHGYGVLTANATALVAEWVASDDGALVDRLVITQRDATAVWPWPPAGGGGAGSAGAAWAGAIAATAVLAAAGAVVGGALAVRRAGGASACLPLTAGSWARVPAIE